jgi:hypothetical protein
MTGAEAVIDWGLTKTSPAKLEIVTPKKAKTNKLLFIKWCPINDFKVLYKISL